MWPSDWRMAQIAPDRTLSSSATMMFMRCSQFDVASAPGALCAGEITAVVPAARLLPPQGALHDALCRLDEVELLRGANRKTLLDLGQLDHRRAQPLRRAGDASVLPHHLT